MFAFKQLEEKFLSIPEDVQEAISSAKTNEKLLILADKYKLQYDEAEELTKEIGYVMLGLKPRNDFVKNIQKVTKLNFEKSKMVAEDINKTIFEDIRESLKKIHSEPEEDDENLDEKTIREELLNEISNPKEKTTDLIKIPKQEIVKQSQSKTDIPILTLDEKQPINVPKPPSTENIEDKQEKPKSYTIDPYREPLD